MPHHRLSIAALLNPVCREPSLDSGPPSRANLISGDASFNHAHRFATAHRTLLPPLPASAGPALAPPLHLLTASRASSSTSGSSAPPSPHARHLSFLPYNASLEVKRDIRINRKTKLSMLHTIDNTDLCIEYPATSGGDPIGYLFRQNSASWLNPTRNFAYSLGRPSGYTKPGKEAFCDVLLDGRDGVSKVPCVKRHATCQGSKICSAADAASLSESHTSVAPNDIKRRLRDERLNHLEVADPNHDVFQKTSAFITGLRRVGCRAPRWEETHMNEVESELYEVSRAHQAELSRGYVPEKDYCLGRLVLDFDRHDNSFIRCEHYDVKANRDHFVQYLDDGYDVDYLDAYFNEDTEELQRIEEEAKKLGYGPLVECTTVSNASSQRLYCPKDHRVGDSELTQLKLEHLPCHARFHTYDPLPEYREFCPWSLVVCFGVHTHPIPLPEKTPPAIRAELRRVLESLDDDLADLTPRRFLRHPILKAHLQRRLPAVSNPTLCDLHPSLANRGHLKYYIDQIKSEIFPSGTGWEGLLHLKSVQDENLPPENHYVRRIVEIPDNDCEAHEDDEPCDIDSTSNCLRMVVCMTKEGSRRMLEGQYMQSDIGFKRVVGFQEFEIACMDRRANTSVIFCRVFLNRQTAVAHQHAFSAIEEIVKIDTGRSLRWRHIHADTKEETDGMILHWAVDQHRGQAKGLGLHLQAVAKRFPQKFDLNQPHRLLSSLSPYEHLHRLVRLCNVHGKRNIRKLAIPETLRKLMRSLMCMHHHNWDGTIKALLESGHKAAADWVNDKLRSKFAFEAMCWEKSFIPKSIWRAGEANSNLIEAVHSDVNREGIHCTLVGGIKKGMAFDFLKMGTLKASEQLGIRPTYRSGHISENTIKNLKRKFNAHHNMLDSQDKKIQQHNKKIRLANKTLATAKHNFEDRLESSHFDPRLQSTDNCQKAHSNIIRAQTKLNKAEAVYNQQVTVGQSLSNTGSGKVGICLPAMQHPAW